MKITLTFLVIVLCQPASAALSFIASGIAGASSVGGNAVVSSLACSGSNVLYVIGVADATASTASVSLTDSQGNTYTKLTNYTSSISHVSIFYSYNATGATNTFTASSGQYVSIVASCFSGANASPIDTHVTTAGACYSCQYNTLTPAEADELFVAVGATENTTGSFTIGSSFTITDQNLLVSSQHEGIAFAYKIITGSTAQDPTWGAGASTGVAIMAAFKPSTTPASPGAYSRRRVIQ